MSLSEQIILSAGKISILYIYDIAMNMSAKCFNLVL